MTGTGTVNDVTNQCSKPCRIPNSSSNYTRAIEL